MTTLFFKQTVTGAVKPYDDSTAELIERLFGNARVSSRVLEELVRMGYDIEVV